MSMASPVNDTIFGKKIFIENTVCVLIFSFYRKHFSLYEEFSDIISYIFIGFYAKNFRLSSHTSIKLELSPQMFEKYSDIKFHENSFSESRIVIIVTDRRYEDDSGLSQSCGST